MKVFFIAVAMVLMAKANAFWFWRRNDGTTAYAGGREIDPECVQLGEAGSCEFYDCFEQRLSCGRDSYIKRHGEHYCDRFERYLENFTEEGQEFVLAAQQCLTAGLVEHYRNNSINCHRLEHIAFRIAGQCFMENNFCSLVRNNAAELLEVFEIDDLFRSGALKLWRELFRLVHGCSTQALTGFLRVSSDRLSPIVNFFARVSEGINK